MEKPKKEIGASEVARGYNQAIDAYEKFLPTVTEIYGMIRKSPLSEYVGIDGVELEVRTLARAIAKRIGVGDG